MGNVKIHHNLGTMKLYASRSIKQLNKTYKITKTLTRINPSEKIRQVIRTVKLSLT